MKAPKGKLIPIGGKEARSPSNAQDSKDEKTIDFFGSGILNDVLKEMKGEESRIEVITSASGYPEEMGVMYQEAFGKLGCNNVDIMHLDGRNVNSKKVLERLADADGVFFTGGDQVQLLDRICDTAFLDALTERYMKDDFVIAGTSAGAMAMASHMIKGGSDSESLLKGIVEMGTGFSFLPGTVIDTHFLSRGRFSRLAAALLECPSCIALGICEDTGLIITEGNLMRTIGSGVVVILEPDEIQRTNYREAKNMEPVYVESFKLHILAEGVTYSLKERKFFVDVDELN
ncbi:cyanophycinase [Telluribacter sp. SYSU D00476]|uniref:cyanophycinase n=1 Tax=Telluribacter sp. SYSU D00476 TaxID=2811430 RepID=UPI001FF1FADD|nr:cyanophycinase [Telluribacter sp. SYSU D00476]